MMPNELTEKERTLLLGVTENRKKQMASRAQELRNQIGTLEKEIPERLKEAAGYEALQGAVIGGKITEVELPLLRAMLETMPYGPIATLVAKMPPATVAEKGQG